MQMTKEVYVRDTIFNFVRPWFTVGKRGEGAYHSQQEPCMRGTRHEFVDCCICEVPVSQWGLVSGLCSVYAILTNLIATSFWSDNQVAANTTPNEPSATFRPIWHRVVASSRSS